MTHRREPAPRWSPGPVRPAPGAKSGGKHMAAGREGREIEPTTRQTMETRFGEDFSGVRVHTDADAAATSERAQAQALTVGEDIAFGPGQYAPATAGGDALLDHELGHVREERHGAPAEVRLQPKDQPVTPGSGAKPAPRLKLDPDIGKLSLGLSTLDHFDFNQSSLKPAHRARIADVAGKLTMLLGKMPAGRIMVTGHTDLVGGEDVNLRVGRNRADAVQQALVEAGVPAASIQSGSEGERTPIVKSTGADGRNRRVEVRFDGELIVPGPPAGPRAAKDASVLSPDGGPSSGTQSKSFDPFRPIVPSTGPTVVPPYLKPGPAAAPASEPKGTEGPTRNASAGDFLGAIAKASGVEDKVKSAVSEINRKTSTGEKAATITIVVSMASLAAAGISTDPAATKAVRDAADGVGIDLSKVFGKKFEGFTFKPKTKDDLGGVLLFDIAKVIR